MSEPSGIGENPGEFIGGSPLRAAGVEQPEASAKLAEWFSDSTIPLKTLSRDSSKASFSALSLSGLSLCPSESKVLLMTLIDVSRFWFCFC